MMIGRFLLSLYVGNMTLYLSFGMSITVCIGVRVGGGEDGRPMAELDRAVEVEVGESRWNCFRPLVRDEVDTQTVCVSISLSLLYSTFV